MLRTTELENGTILNEEIVLATLISVGTVLKTNKNGKDYRWCKVSLEYPDGDVAVVDARLWEGSYLLHKDKFEPNSPVALAIQIEGEYAGVAKVELPPFARVDLAKLGIKVTETAQAVEVNA